MSALSLADVGSSCAASLGVPTFQDRLGLGEARHAVVVLIDGLGFRLLAQYPQAAPFLSAQCAVAAHPMIQAVFPSTTVSALSSFGTGLLPGAHGMVGSSFMLPETDTVLAPLQWGNVPHPLAVQPERTIFEAAATHGIRVTTVAPAKYEHSGLTRAALRGAQYRAAEDAATRLAYVGEELRRDERAFSYVYWPEVDRIGHGSGVGSAKWCEAVGRADALVASIAKVLGPDDVVVVTADHGMVNIDQRIAIEAEPTLMAGVIAIAGEPRMRHVYTSEPASIVAERWRDLLGSSATVMTREEVVSEQLMGPVDDALVERIGDVVAIASGRVGLSSLSDPTVSSLIGQHGAQSPEEREIPAIILRG